MINTNLISTIQATKAVVNEMKQNGYGSIVITSSLASFCGIYGLSVYSATKFALRGFAEALSMEVNTYWVSKDTWNNIYLVMYIKSFIYL